MHLQYYFIVIADIYDTMQLKCSVWQTNDDTLLLSPCRLYMSSFSCLPSFVGRSALVRWTEMVWTELEWFSWLHQQVCTIPSDGIYWILHLSSRFRMWSTAYSVGKIYYLFKASGYSISFGYSLSIMSSFPWHGDEAGKALLIGSLFLLLSFSTINVCTTTSHSSNWCEFHLRSPSYNFLSMHSEEKMQPVHRDIFSWAKRVWRLASFFHGRSCASTMQHWFSPLPFDPYFQTLLGEVFQSNVKHRIVCNSWECIKMDKHCWSRSGVHVHNQDESH